MRHITRRTTYPSRADRFALVFIGDVHLGNLHCDERTLQQLAWRITNEESTYWLGLGDFADYINLRDPRFDPSELPDWLLGREALKDIARAQTDRFLRFMEPTAGRCLALCEGNHEWAILQHSEADVYSRIIEGLADKAWEHRLDHRGLVTWIFKRGDAGQSWALNIYATHGSNGGRAMGSTAGRLEDLAGQCDGIDVVVQGHTHKTQHLALSKWRPGKRGIDPVTIHCINIPALCSDMAYADRKDMRAVPTGWVELGITPDSRRVEVRTVIV